MFGADVAYLGFPREVDEPDVDAVDNILRGIVSLTVFTADEVCGSDGVADVFEGFSGAFEEFIRKNDSGFAVTFEDVVTDGEGFGVRVFAGEFVEFGFVLLFEKCCPFFGTVRNGR